MRLRLLIPNRAVITAVGGAVLGFGVASALAGRTDPGPGELVDGSKLDDPSGVELDGLLGDYELEMLLNVLDDVEIEEFLDGDLERS